MHSMRAVGASLLILAYVALLPAITSAQSQTGGTIGGVVKDTTGAVLPGVTVEASSTALIEKVRTAVTDGEGVYKIVDLRPGVYAVTFTLAGFSTVRREGIELSTGFTATINADLRVGAVEETITVLGQSPLVDVQGSTQRRTISAAVAENLPTGKTPTNFAVLIPGVVGGAGSSQDVGGTSRHGPQPVAIYGSRASEHMPFFDGMKFGSMWNTGGGRMGYWEASPGAIEEYAIATSGASADADVSGVRINIIPKQGGNKFSGYFLGNYANDKLQSSNLDDALKAHGANAAAVTKKVWDVNPAVGGPIKQDKLWFYTSFRYWGLTQQFPSLYNVINPADFVFRPDLSRPAYAPQYSYSTNLRLTWQTSRSSKLALYGDHIPRCRCADSALYANLGGEYALRSYEATTRLAIPVNSLFQATWNWAATNRLLIEVGQTYRPEQWAYQRQPEVPPDYSGVIEGRTGALFRAPILMLAYNGRQWNGQAAASYVTGSHNLKVGSQWLTGYRTNVNDTNNNSTYNTLDGVPVSVTYATTPYESTQNIKLNLGIYGQEQWTLKRLTLNLGGRFDYINGYVPAQHAPAVQYVPFARDFPGIDNVPNQKDLVPRLGASYDLFGTGKTALKVSAGKYLEGTGIEIAAAVNPASAPAGTTGVRAWNDLNHDFIPQENELGPNSNANFGKSIVPIRYAPDTVTGWSTRGWNWEMSGALQHELRPGVSVETAYHRRWFGNQRVTRNALVTLADYNPYCVTAPTDPRLPGGGGQQMCGLYDITPTKFGLSDNNVTFAKDFGEQSEIYDGIDVTVNTRLRGGVTLQGGTNTGRARINTCYVVNSPQELRFCDVRPPFQTQVKFLGVYPLPWWGLLTSATYQSLPVPEITASWAAPSALIAPSLGRSLAGGARSATVALVSPGTLYGDHRLHQVDFRIARNFRIAGVRLQGLFDLYNMFNANPILAYNNVYGPAWQNPLLILEGRLAKFGIQLDF